jgi:hypothetical protein
MRFTTKDTKGAKKSRGRRADDGIKDNCKGDWKRVIADFVDLMISLILF